MDKEKLFSQIAPQAPLPPVRFTEQHKSIVRGTFRDEWHTLTILRDLFFGIQLTEFEKGVVKNLSPEVKSILSMMMRSVIDKNTPIGDSKDAWSQLDLRGLDLEKQKQEIAVRETLDIMLVKAIKLLEDPNGDKPFSTLQLDPVFIMARADFINITENKLRLLHSLAYSVEETPEATKKKIQQNSSK
jgi:hypothetical protein